MPSDEPNMLQEIFNRIGDILKQLDKLNTSVTELTATMYEVDEEEDEEGDEDISLGDEDTDEEGTDEAEAQFTSEGDSSESEASDLIVD